jgi:hypothetical protein
MRPFLLSVLLFAACNEEGDAPNHVLDSDSDGFAESDDCDDDNADVNPDATESCNGVDDDCNDLVDDDATDATAFYEDADADGFGGTITVTACEVPVGYVALDGDCDDSDGTINPGADELCDSADRDCDGNPTAGAMDVSSYSADSDGDGFGDPNDSQQACAAPTGFVGNDTDCNDDDAQLNPNTEWYPDMDRDGFGSQLSTPTQSCERLVSASLNNADCNDLNNRINPDGLEVCDNTDNDCDGFVDDLFCVLYDGTWTGGFQLGAVEAAGTVVVNNMQCTSGIMELVVDHEANPVVQGTASCSYSGGLRGFDGTQSGTFTGEVSINGVVTGQYTHEYGSNPSDTYDYEVELVDSVGTLLGEGGYRPSAFSAVDWQVDFSSTLDQD